ncbi:MAG: hypothetical protein AB8H80_21620 [Planctomycetota bacterium]
MKSRMLRSLAAAMALCAIAAGQATTWIATPQNPLRQLMPQVQNGDTVLVAPGSYMGFRCDKGVTIRAQMPGTVTVNFAINLLPSSCGCSCQLKDWSTDLLPPPGHDLHISGIDFGGYQSINVCFGAFRHFVRATGGRVTFDDCRIDRLQLRQTTAHLQGCDVTSISGPGIDAQQSNVTIVGGSVAGANVSNVFASVAPAPGIALEASRLQLSHASVQGGDPGTTTQATPGLIASGASSTWVTDTTIAASGSGTCAVEATGVLRIDRSTLIGAGSGGGAACSTSPLGAPLTGINRQGPIEIGTMFEATMQGVAGDLQIFYGATSLAGPIALPLVDQPIWLTPSDLFFSQLGLADTNGASHFAFQVPPVVALVGTEFWLQGVAGSTLPLQTTAVVGGLVR